MAAPTFGLPEAIGHGRNWDYRYTWIRDSSFTLYGLNRLGYNDEAAAFMKWMEARVGEMEPDQGLQLMYGIDGRHKLDESVLENFEGYRGSRPVRIGNAAYSQLQLDIYGELMDAVYLFNKYGRPIDYDGWQDIVKLVDYVCANYRQPDEGIWEVRGGKQEFLYSRLMCWVAVDRGIRLAQRRSFPDAAGPTWFKTRDDIYRQIFTDFWDPQQKLFIQAIGRNEPDAASLLMPMVRFISPTDRRWLSTLRAIERDLVDDSLVYRYRGADGLEGARKARSACARSGTWNASRAAATWSRRGSCSRRCSVTRTTSGCTPRSWARAASTWATFRRRSRTWGSSARPTISTVCWTIRRRWCEPSAYCLLPFPFRLPAGNFQREHAAFPSLLSTVTRPPCASATVLTNDSPRPLERCEWLPPPPGLRRT